MYRSIWIKVEPAASLQWILFSFRAIRHIFAGDFMIDFKLPFIFILAFLVKRMHSDHPSTRCPSLPSLLKEYCPPASCSILFEGAQLKTMHNARLMACHRLTDLCRPSDIFEPGALDTRRLHMNLSLYRRGLNGLVLLVNRDPYFHIHNRTGRSLWTTILDSSFFLWDPLETVPFNKKTWNFLSTNFMHSFLVLFKTHFTLTLIFWYAYRSFL